MYFLNTFILKNYYHQSTNDKISQKSISVIMFYWNKLVHFFREINRLHWLSEGLSKAFLSVRFLITNICLLIHRVCRWCDRGYYGTMLHQEGCLICSCTTWGSTTAVCTSSIPHREMSIKKYQQRFIGDFKNVYIYIIKCRMHFFPLFDCHGKQKHITISELCYNVCVVNLVMH